LTSELAEVTVRVTKGDEMSQVTSASRHLTASAIVFNDQGSVLLVFHNMYRQWVFPGGHVDPDETPGEAAAREVEEETGIKAWHAVSVVPLWVPETVQHPSPIDTREFVAPAKPDRDGKPAEPQHRHIDQLFVMHAAGGLLTAQLDEVTGVKWVSMGEIADLDTREDVLVLLTYAKRLGY
jgi:8-oxo-dGTP diphosphatase